MTTSERRADFDVVVRGAWVHDGDATPAYEADVGVRDGLIAQVGTVSGRGDEELDGRGLHLAPGFIDPHTHLDANLFWDPDLTPSSGFGVTTVVLGNCGFTLAPVSAATRDYVIDVMSIVEQIPRASLEDGVPWDWQSLDDYFERLDRTPSLLNFGVYVGHAPVRAAAMGADDCHERDATPAEIDAMVALVRRGLELGALGFTTEQVEGNAGPNGRPLPGNICADDELLAIARALGEGPGPGLCAMANRALLLPRAAREADFAWHQRLAAASGRPVIVGPVFDHHDDPGIGYDLVELMTREARPGVRVVPQVSTRVFELWTRLDTSRVQPGVLVRSLPSLQRALHDGGTDAVRALAADEQARARLRAEGDAMVANLVFSGRWDHVYVRITRPERMELAGRNLADLAAERGVHPTDVLLDVAIADDFETQFATVMTNGDDEQVGRMLAHPGAVIGASDAGAHIQSNTDSCYAVWTLQHWVRERDVLSLERAVQMLTADQADLHGFTDRGRIHPGLAADLVLFDADHVATTGVEFLADQPRGGTRLVTRATGIEATLVNGVVATREGRSTGARPGRRL